MTNIQQWLDLHRAGVSVATTTVQLRGMVTVQIPDRRGSFFLHDGSASIQVFTASTSPALPPGSLVEVDGIRRVNEYGPYVGDAQVTVLGDGPLPAPQPGDLGLINRGLDYGAWVELELTVLDVMLNDGSPSNGRLWLLANSGVRVCNVVVLAPWDHLPEELLNLRVSVRGVVLTTLDASARPIGSRILVASNEWMRVSTPISTNRFDRPRRTARGLRGPPASDERVLLRGVVTHASPTGWFVLQDESGALQVEKLGPMPVRSEQEQHVQRAPATSPRPGDWVEAVATHARSRAMSPVVGWADHRVMGTTNLPAPTTVAAAQLNDAAHDCRRVKVRAQVVDQSSHMDGPHHFSVLVLQDGAARFDAVLSTAKPWEFPVRAGDFVEVTGVCTTRAAAASARVFLSSTHDVRWLTPPSRWLTGTAARLALASATALVLALVWVWSLRRRVTLRTAELAASNEQLRRNEKELQRALAQEQELHQLKANFVSMVSHEFRTPLGVIVSSTDILRRYLDRLNPRMRTEQLDIIQRSTRTLSGLVEDLLLLGKAEAGKLVCQPAPLDVETFCRHLADEVDSATKQACPIQLTLEGDFTGAMGDESLLRPALTNLLTNAIKYSPAGAPVEVRVIRRDGAADFVIGDRGIGIPAADQSRLFTAFARGTNVGATPGTGLGLVIAKRCVDLHGGMIQFRSEAGEGTTFTLTLPLFKSRSEADPSSSPRPANHPHTTA